MRAYRVAYDGRPYHGFQRQPDVSTVEDELLSALRELDVIDDGTPPNYAAAGRTDAGVSARAQTVAFEATDWLSPAAFSSELPETIHVWASAEAPADFHATHDAVKREYTYFLHAPVTEMEHVSRVLDELAGEHDFHNLTPDDTGTVRDLSTTCEREGEFVRLQFTASGFPRQFVRRAVGVVDSVACGDRSLSYLDRILADEPLSGPDGIQPASPAPLVLTAVCYSDIEFTAHERAVATAHSVFERQRAELAAQSRVADILSGRSSGDRSSQ